MKLFLHLGDSELCKSYNLVLAVILLFQLLYKEILLSHGTVGSYLFL